MSEQNPITAARFVRNVAETYGLQLHRYLVRRHRAGEDAADMAQEVYLRLLRLHRCDLIRNPVSYVYFLASQVASEHRLRRSLRPVVYDTELMTAAADNANGEVAVEGPERSEVYLQELQRLLAKLRPLHRTVFLLQKRDGCSIREVAAILGMRESKVKRCLWHAHRKLGLKFEPREECATGEEEAPRL
jgi:RNA polymerase sigma factor (sigma-70 family)